MNAIRPVPATARPVPASTAGRDGPAAPALRRIHRPRDFGVGYGTSSGYASDRHYAPANPALLFRFV